MSNTYTQIYIQYVFAVQNRISLISPSLEEELYKYITGIVQNHKHKMIAINGMPDHLHLFIGQHPTQSCSNLIQVVKRDSSAHINNKGWGRGKFSWQQGFGAFSYSRKEIDIVYHYVMNQKEHHKKTTFIDEYIGLLVEFNIDYDMKYIMKPITDD